ncbi:MAG: type I DNA topoisomerase [Acidothermus sp.]|nr:type I DNA topoisomerase [Acidothermus sp.]
MAPRSSATATRRRSTDGGTRLVIVESPAKARTIAGFLGPGYVVESSVGHVRDLPASAAEIPEKYKKEPWARLGVNVDKDFEPLYVVTAEKRKQVAKLKQALANADELYLATDEDREGEAIAWHLVEVLKPRVPVRRMVFHEITRQAIEEATRNPREINQALVDAQETRRILDRLYGYEISPVLWKKVMPALSAGRVQSVATRMVVERERERMAFRPASYWDLAAEVATDPSFTATLVALDGKRVAVGRDFDSQGRLKSTDVVHLSEDDAARLAADLRGAEFVVRSVERKPYRRSPAAPFITSTLQQEASRKLQLGSQATMRLAQRLYEGGYITYMRTDSTTLSETALRAARAQIAELYGDALLPADVRRYEKKVKNAQEAHEAIRPAGERFRTPAELAGELSRDELRLYELIWQRTLASQMIDATGHTVSLRIAAITDSGQEAIFAASGTVITEPGFLRVYVEGSDDEEENAGARVLPDLAEGQVVPVAAVTPSGHTTTPPARYTEASLIRALEERGIGRPSTFASIVGTIIERDYVFKRGQALVPTFLAFAVVRLLERYFGNLVDYDFTAEMEENLDRIANGEAHRLEWLTRFYFGSPTDGRSAAGLKTLVTQQLAEIDARDIATFPLGESGIVVRVGRYGTYVERDGRRATLPAGVAPDEVTVEYATKLLEQPNGERELGVDPETGNVIVVRNGRYGPYVTEVLPEGAKGKPRTASLLSSMAVDSVTLDDALRLLALPRVLGEVDGEQVIVSNGRYGPYVKKGVETRSLPSDDLVFSITLEEALALLAQPKQRGRRTAVPAQVRELGTDPVTGRPVVARSGRFGPYVTDGETNATLRHGDTLENVTLERAVELLADRRSRGPATPRTRRTRRAAARTE